ncbi:MAG: MATE family efflux transporter, partial [Deltaproteobacteria bacterium]|nr:MATE family efflux transporter [Deltaproteobacteria bacterium]
PERRRRILGLALPIIGGMLSQNVLNLVDTAMVGTLGDAALAGVGLGGFANFLFSAFVLGLSTGVQAMAARRVGEGRLAETAIPLNGGLLLALTIAVPWSALLISLAPEYFPLLTGDAAVVEQGVPYLQARLFAMFAMGMNFAFRGYWNAVDKSILYMRTLISMHVVNIFLNWVLIFGNLGAPELGAAGAGVASAIATVFGTASYFLLGRSYARGAGFLHGLPSRETMSTIIRLAAPAGLQQFFFAAGMTVFLMLVARMGTPELAATKVIIDLILVGILPGIGFGLAAASLAGQALGRGNAEDAKQWGWDVTKIAILVVGALSIPAVLVPEWLLSGFIHEPSTLALAKNPLRLVAGFLFLDAVGMVLMNALMGVGDTKRVMLIGTGFQWLIFLPAVYVVGPVMGLGLVVVFAAQVIYRGFQSLTFALMWKQGRWQSIEIH